MEARGMRLMQQHAGGESHVQLGWARGQTETYLRMRGPSLGPTFVQPFTNRPGQRCAHMLTPFNILLNSIMLGH